MAQNSLKTSWLACVPMLINESGLTALARPFIGNEGRLIMSNPFDVLSQFDRLTSSVFDTARAPRLMPVDLFRDGDQYVLSADMPGIDPATVDVDVDGQLLTIRAERRAPASESVQWLVHERPYGAYMRQFTLGDGVDAERITANYDHGVLSVIVPMADRAKPRKIQIGSAQANDRKQVTV